MICFCSFRAQPTPNPLPWALPWVHAQPQHSLLAPTTNYTARNAHWAYGLKAQKHIAQGKRSDTLGTCALPNAHALKGQKHNYPTTSPTGTVMLLLFQSAQSAARPTQGAALGYVHIGLSARLTTHAVIKITPLAQLFITPLTRRPTQINIPPPPVCLPCTIFA